MKDRTDILVYVALCWIEFFFFCMYILCSVEDSYIRKNTKTNENNLFRNLILKVLMSSASFCAQANTDMFAMLSKGPDFTI